MENPSFQSDVFNLESKKIAKGSYGRLPAVLACSNQLAIEVDKASLFP
jgi:hypothetical protein